MSQQKYRFFFYIKKLSVVQRFAFLKRRKNEEEEEERDSCCLGFGEKAAPIGASVNKYIQMGIKQSFFCCVLGFFFIFCCLVCWRFLFDSFVDEILVLVVEMSSKDVSCCCC